jgi:DNA-binding NarL/FixJ family response regulator
MANQAGPDAPGDIRRRASVFVIEPHEVCHRAMLRLLRESGSDLVPIGAVKDAAAGVELAAGLEPDVVLMATIDPEDYAHVREVVRRTPKARVVVLGIRGDGWAVSEAFRAGASGFVPKWAPPEDILEALEAVSRGDTFVHPSVAGQALIWAFDREQQKDENQELLLRLTRRECEILDMLEGGLPSGVMAERLFLSRRTVESHLASAYRKLGVHGRMEAAQVYRRLRDPGNEATTGSGRIGLRARGFAPA